MTFGGLDVSEITDAGDTPMAPTRALEGAPAGANPVKPKDSQRQLLYAVAFAVAILLVILIMWHMKGARRYRYHHHWDGFSGGTTGQKLAAKGWVMVTADWCGYCKKQKALLPGYPMEIETGKGGAIISGYTKTPPFDLKTVKSFPTWKNIKTGETKLGFQQEAALEAMAA